MKRSAFGIFHFILLFHIRVEHFARHDHFNVFAWLSEHRHVIAHFWRKRCVCRSNRLIVACSSALGASFAFWCVERKRTVDAITTNISHVFFSLFIFVCFLMEMCVSTNEIL